MTDVATLVNKHRANGLLIDTNLLILYLVGRTNQQRIGTFKRTRAYTQEDYHLLEDLIAHFKRIVTTPQILTETSNLTDMSGPELRKVRDRFRDSVEDADQSITEAKRVVKDQDFLRLGFADSAAALASEAAARANG